MTVYVNGQFIDLPNEIKDISLYNLGVYTSLCYKNGQIQQQTAHFDRLLHDAKAILDQTISTQSLQDHLQCYSDTLGSLDCIIRITLFASPLTIAKPLQGSNNNILLSHRPSSPITTPARLQTYDLFMPLAAHKLTNHIGLNMHYRKQAQDSGFDDALRCVDGFIKEGPTWNIFFVQDTTLITPPLDGHILPGVMRNHIIQMAKENGLAVKEDPIALDALSSYQAAFITNCAYGYRKISQIDETPLDPDHAIFESLSRF